MGRALQEGESFFDIDSVGKPVGAPGTKRLTQQSRTAEAPQRAEEVPLLESPEKMYYRHELEALRKTEKRLGSIRSRLVTINEVQPGATNQHDEIHQAQIDKSRENEKLENARQLDILRRELAKRETAVGIGRTQIAIRKLTHTPPPESEETLPDVERRKLRIKRADTAAAVGGALSEVIRLPGVVDAFVEERVPEGIFRGSIADLQRQRRRKAKADLGDSRKNVSLDNDTVTNVLENRGIHLVGQQLPGTQSAERPAATGSSNSEVQRKPVVTLVFQAPNPTALHQAHA